MHKNTFRALATSTLAGALLLSTTTTASAASVTVIRSGDGDTLRARFYDGPNGTGDRLEYYGSNACTSTTADADFSYSTLVKIGWNDRIESIRDYNGCDVNVYRDVDFKGGSTGYVNYGSVGKNLTSAFRNLPSSFRVS